MIRRTSSSPVCRPAVALAWLSRSLILVLASATAPAIAPPVRAAPATAAALGPYVLGMAIPDCPGQPDTRERGLEDPPIITCSYQKPQIFGSEGRRLDLAGRDGKLQAILFSKGPAGGQPAAEALVASLERDWGPATAVRSDGHREWVFAQGAQGAWIPLMGLVSLRSADASERPTRSVSGSSADRGSRATAGAPAPVSLTLDADSGQIAIGGHHLGGPLPACPDGTRLERSWPKFPGARSCQLRVARVGPLPAEQIELIAIDDTIVRIRSHGVTGNGGNYVRPSDQALTEIKMLLGKESGTSDFGLTLNWKGEAESLKLQRTTGRLDLAVAGFEQAGLPGSTDPTGKTGIGLGGGRQAAAVGPAKN